MTSPSPKPVVCVQGLGFVGAAMALAVANASNPDGSPAFAVIGVDLPTPEGQRRIDEINAGRFPFACIDSLLEKAAQAARDRGNLTATADPIVYEKASVAIVDVHLDVRTVNGVATADMTGFRSAIRTLGERLPLGALIIVETTVPPGTTAKIAAPELESALHARGLPLDAILLAHSYERVMPGPDYLQSVVHFWRVYAGHTEAAGAACRDFLSKVIDVERFPLTQLKSTTASETAKVLENSYRAVNIAFMDEWSRFAECVGVDLFEVVDAIRVRPTHNNIRQPGLGVGGYCLTKDPHFAPIAAREIFGLPHLAFPFSTQAVAINAATPMAAVSRLEQLLGGSLRNQRVLLLGVAYRSDVADTRFSPSEPFVRAVMEKGASVVCRDPLVTYWDELSLPISAELPSPADFDAVVFAVPHSAYRDIDVPEWIGDARCAVLDVNRVLSPSTVATLRNRGARVAATGVGESA